MWCDYKMKQMVILLLLLTLCTGIVNAQPTEQIVVNSADWVDVYSTIMYANLGGIPYHFVISEDHAPILPQYMDKNLSVRLVESDSVPYVVNYESILKDSEFTVMDKTLSPGGRELNLELAGKLDINKFIVVDDSYGYNAISAASYAVKSRSWVLFADRTNIDDVYTFLNGRNIESILVYGHVDKAVSDRLSEYNPERINEGSRFDDNLAIVTRYMEIAPAGDVILTNGDFIEANIMSGERPVVFIGKDNVPGQVIDFVENSSIMGSVVIGNDLIYSAKQLKDATGMIMFIMFGQSNSNAGSSLVGELDKFYLPQYELTLDVVSAQYNEATKQLEIIYRNDAKIGEFFKSSIGVFADGERIATVGDETPTYIEAESESGRAYGVDLTNYARNSNITAEINTEFGEAPKSLNLLLEKVLDVSTISVADESEIEVIEVVYNKQTQRLELTMKNTGGVPCYASQEVTMLIDEMEETLRFGTAIPLEVGEEKTVSQRIELTAADLADNPEVYVEVWYGERPTLLIKKFGQMLPLKVSGNLPTVLIVLASLVAIAMLVMIRRLRKNGVKYTEVCSECGAPMPDNAQFCMKCGIKNRKND